MKHLQNKLGFDEQPCDEADISDVDWARARAMLESRGVDTDDMKWQTLGLLSKRGGELVPTPAGLILFGHEPQNFFPYAKMRCGAFKGTTKTEIIDSLDIQGTLIDALIEVPKFIARNERESVLIDSMNNREVSEYPKIAIREALVNAVAHADYSLSGTGLSIQMFSDRLIIQNPGMLHFGMTLNDVRAGVSKLRNRAISHTLRELGFMEEWGSGYERMVSTCREDGYPDPELEETATTFRVILQSHPRIVRRDNPLFDTRKIISERYQRILAAIARLDRPQRKDIVQETGISLRMLKRDLGNLTEQGWVERVGSNTKDGYYRVCK